ncbi:MAG: sigma-70 family RNA polymerase sigma factor [Gammaproteobacteria bacterium]|nr:sigma-70 family RNA polymerase sigma factor [Gammaproteobacteria bacterium]
MTDPRDDAALMLAYAGGDAAAFEILYARHRNGLFRYLVRMIGNRAESEEVFQEVWLNLINARERYAPTAKFSTYLYTLAHHRAVDHLRRPRVAAGAQIDADEAAAPAAQQPDARAAHGQAVTAALAALSQLPEEQRSAVLLKEYGGLSLAEIAAATGVKQETAKSRLRYAFDKLRSIVAAGEQHER